MTENWQWVLLVAGAVVAGAANTLAGGGSLLTVPLLILLGLSPVSANATNRIGTLTQSLTAGWAFGRRGLSGLRLGWKLLPSGLLGAGLGAYGATAISDEAFRTVFGWLMVPLGVLFFLVPKERWLRRSVGGAGPERGTMLAFFAVGLYAGFLQVGYGLFALAVLVLMGGRGLAESNAIKAVISAALAAVSLAVFATRVEIDVAAGIAVGAGSALGGYVGTWATLERGERWIRPVVLVICLALAFHMLRG